MIHKLISETSLLYTLIKNKNPIENGVTHQQLNLLIHSEILNFILLAFVIYNVLCMFEYFI